MTNKELQIIADILPFHELICDEVTEHYNEWCERNCGRVGGDQCWRKYINLKLEEMKNETD